MNNRQSGRRRGRGGQRPQGSGGNRDNGNRIDNRARGNAPQLLEKYKNLARDAQLQGDRVMTEYYLQFADHYFRVVSENRARFEENRRQRDDWQQDDGDQVEGLEGEMADEGEGESRDSQPRQRRDNRDSRDNRDDRRNTRRPRHDNDSDVPEIEGPGTDALPADLLPPAIGIADMPALSRDLGDDEADAPESVDPEPRRRRGRTRRPEAEDVGEAAE
jgi:hypothetical protein